MEHHAYITKQSSSDVVADLVKSGVHVVGNPDVLQLSYAEVSVDDSRMISTYAFLKPIGDKKYIVISFDRAGVEAQNALLKVVEEAPGNTIFYFCTPQPGALIPTLRSRCVAISSESRVQRSEIDDAKEFLKLGFAERLALVEKLVTTAQKAGDRTSVREFARSLVVVHPSRATLDAVRYLDQNGSSPKLVLSHLAVSLPLVATP